MLLNGNELCDFCFENIGESKVCPYCGLTHENYDLPAGLLQVGTNLNGEYIIGKVLGRGGFGATYMAYSGRLGKAVALKEYLPAGVVYRGKGEARVELISENVRSVFEKGAERFKEEAVTVSQFKACKEIVSVYACFEANDTVYYAMEYLEGSDIKKYVQKNGPVSEEKGIEIILQACKALSTVHSSFTLHRDIAPDNLFLCSDGTVKLIDFGAAKHVIANEQQNYSIVVKQGFAPVEQYMKNKKQTPATDIYALAATMFYMFTGQVPPLSADLLDTELDFGNAYISDGIKYIIRKGMRYKAEERYQSVIELLVDLESLRRTGYCRNQNQPVGQIDTIKQETKPENWDNHKYINARTVEEELHKKNSNSTMYVLLGVATGLLCGILIIMGVISFGGKTTGGFDSGGGGGSKIININTNHGGDKETVDPTGNSIDEGIIDNIISNYEDAGDVAIYVENLTTKEKYCKNENVKMNSSALYQVVLLAYTAEQYERGEIDLETDLYFNYESGNGKESLNNRSGYLDVSEWILDIAKYGDNSKTEQFTKWLADCNEYDNDYLNEQKSMSMLNEFCKRQQCENTEMKRFIRVKRNEKLTEADKNKTTAADIAKLFAYFVNSDCLKELGNSPSSVLASIDTKGNSIGLKKDIESLGKDISVGNVNALNDTTCNNVSILEKDGEQVLVAILTDGEPQKTKERTELQKELIEYIVGTQFE